MTEDQYLSLCEKYLKGDCTPEEALLIKSYQEAQGLNTAAWDNTTMGNPDRIRELLHTKLQESIGQRKPSVITIRKWQWASAAAVILMVSVSLFFLKSDKPKLPGNLTAVRHHTRNDILPGANKAVLTLANGARIVLDSARNGVLSHGGNAAISKSGHQLIVGKNDNNNQPAANNMATISIPRGGKYDVVLPDGTKVWLNSASSLTFPTAFTGTERKVTLTGEAYFEVAKNKRMPFKINVNEQQTVEVLGTHFNVSAYADERRITTTLLEGSVKVNYKNKDTFIKPGQKAVNNLTEAITVQPADTDEAIAWKNGMFVFNNENITEIMKQVSRWYDVDIIFKGNMDKVNFTGNYSRSKSLSNLLKNIELTDKVKFIVEGRRLTIIAQ